MILHTLNGWMEAIESHPWFVLLDLAFHLFILGHVAHHVIHATHRHLWSRLDRLGTKLAVEALAFIYARIPSTWLTANLNVQLSLAFGASLRRWNRLVAERNTPTVHDHKHEPWRPDPEAA